MMKKSNHLARILFLSILLGMHISNLHAQKNFLYPFYYPPITLDTLAFSHPEIEERIFLLIEELEHLQQKTISRYKDEITFEHAEPKPNFWTISKERLSPEEFNQLIQLAFKPVKRGDSAIFFLNFNCQVLGSGPFQLHQYNEKLEGEFHLENGMGPNDQDENYVLFGENRDTVFLGEYQGFIGTYENTTPDTLEGTTLGIIGYFPDSHRTKVAGLPEEAYGITFQSFLNDWTVLEVGYDYIILPISDPLIGDIDEP